MKLLLHACCGPCSLEPVRLVREAGHAISIAYMNSNIHPLAEYEQRRDTLCTWAHNEGIPVIEGVYNPQKWEETSGKVAATPHAPRAERCRLCYRLRFEETAAHAASHEFEAMGTTLSVSPYQFTKIIKEELERAALPYGLTALFEDYRPYYPEATQRSRALKMYRQNYCGCHISIDEAAEERAERKRLRKLKKQQEKEQQLALKASSTPIQINAKNPSSSL